MNKNLISIVINIALLLTSILTAGVAGDFVRTINPLMPLVYVWFIVSIFQSLSLGILYHLWMTPRAAWFYIVITFGASYLIDNAFTLLLRM